MALATTCPQCQTSFKVVPDQLKLRRGLVRCGVCQHVFSGIDNLRYVNEPRTAPRPSAAPSGAESPDLKTAFFLPETVIGDNRADARREGPGASPLRPEPPPQRTPESPADDGGRSDTDGRADARHDPNPPGHPDAVASERDDGRRGSGHDRREGTREPRHDDHREARHERRRKRRQHHDDATIAAHPDRPGEPAGELSGAFAPPKLRTPSRTSQRRVAITAGALGLLLLLQLALGSRDLLAARVPAIRPLLSTLGAPLGLEIELPRLPGKLTIESFELTGAGPAGVYKLDALLRNRASHPVQWPAIELTLTDAFGGVVASKVLLPRDYHFGEQIDAGFPGNSEESVSLDIAIDEVIPSGYRAILFYP